jgi:hypothetical protein
MLPRGLSSLLSDKAWPESHMDIALQDTALFVSLRLDKDKNES